MTLGMVPRVSGLEGSHSGTVQQRQYICALFNPLPTIGNSLKKQKSLYKVLTPSIKPPIEILMGLWELMTHIMRHWLVKG